MTDIVVDKITDNIADIVTRSATDIHIDIVTHILTDSHGASRILPERQALILCHCGSHVFVVPPHVHCKTIQARPNRAMQRAQQSVQIPQSLTNPTHQLVERVNGFFRREARSCSSSDCVSPFQPSALTAEVGLLHNATHAFNSLTVGASASLSTNFYQSTFVCWSKSFAILTAPFAHNCHSEAEFSSWETAADCLRQVPLLPEEGGGERAAQCFASLVIVSLVVP